MVAAQLRRVGVGRQIDQARVSEDANPLIADMRLEHDRAGDGNGLGNLGVEGRYRQLELRGAGNGAHATAYSDVG